MKDLMIDLETLATTPDTVVISIGACFFDPIFGRSGATFSANLDIQSQLDHGRRVSASTLKWWMNQSTEAKSLFREETWDIQDGLENFTAWVEANREQELYPWGNGSLFDIAIMESLLHDYEQKVPWKYSDVMDLRTFRRFCANNTKVDRAAGTHHNALDDALNQAAYVIQHIRKVQQ